MTYEGKTVLNYTLTRKLGEGGFGAVYLAEHAELGRRAAIKILHHQFASQPAMVERFFQEARAVCAINHRAIIAIENFGRLDNNEPFYLMEFFPGGSLTQIASQGWLTSDQLIAILDPIVDALGAAHAKGIIHRDLKPDNIMVRLEHDRVADVRLLDFGIAKLLDGASHTGTGNSMGTPAFMPPEQALDAKNVDVRADVYSFGATVYTAVGGKPPFEGSSVAAILLMVQTDTAPLLPAVRPDVPASLDAAIRRCLAKHRDHRPASIAEAWRAIREELVRARLSSTPQPLGQATPVPMRATPFPKAEPATDPEVRAKSKLPLVLGGVGVLAIGGIAIGFAISGGSKPVVVDASVAVVTPDAAVVAPPSVQEPGEIGMAEVSEAFTRAAKDRIAGCGKAGSRLVGVTFKLELGADSKASSITVDGETTTIAECVRKALVQQDLGLPLSRGGGFIVKVDMPADAKTVAKPSKPPDPKPPDPKPACDATGFEAMAKSTATSDGDLRTLLRRVNQCMTDGGLSAGDGNRIKDLIVNRLSS